MVISQWLKHLSYIKAIEHGQVWGTGDINGFVAPWYCYTALIIPLFSCYRLAKFNLDTRQSHGFLGLPTPANAIFFVSLVLVASFFPYATDSYWTLPNPDMPKNLVNELAHGPAWTLYPTDHLEGLSPFVVAGVMNRWVVMALVLVFSFLLVSELPLFALKFKNFGWNDNKIRYIFLGLAALLLICFWFTAIPFIVILYLLLSILNNIVKITV
jgi:CDP-diacylglycerol--serine O-phosphatidyltransferase